MAPPPLHLNIGQQPVPTVRETKILGLHIHTNGKADAAVTNIIRQGNQLLQVSRRIANRHSGLKEADLSQLHDAMIVSRIRYAIPYCTLTKQHHEKLNALLRKSIKLAMGVPMSTPNKEIHNTGLYITCESIVAAHKHNQLARLRSTTPGQDLLRLLKFTLNHSPEQEKPINQKDHSQITVAPIPRQMDKEKDDTRRKIRATYLAKKIRRTPNERHIFTDASNHNNQWAWATVEMEGTEATGTCPCTQSTEAEIYAIGQAI